MLWSMEIFSILLFFVIARSSAKEATNNGKIVCYFVSENGYARAPPELLNPNLCTHAIYAFAAMDNDGTLQIRNHNLDIRHKMYDRFLALKKGNADLKVLVSIQSSRLLFSAVAADESKRRNFAQSTRAFLETHGFDGIDLDWEKPYANDRDNFVELVKEIKHEFTDTEFILSIAVFPMCTQGYNAQELSKYADLILVMNYNYYGHWGTRTGQHSGLYPSSKDTAYERKNLNNNASIWSWITAGVPRDKLMMGIPFYGRTFTLKDPYQHGIHAPITGGGNVPVPTYRQIPRIYANWTVVWDDEQKNYYRYGGKEWVGYEEERSVREKVSYAISHQLGGLMIWHLGGDDIRGEFGPKQGLLQVVNDAFRPTTSSTASPTSTSSSTSTTPTTSITSTS